jgi:hypothetical protein
MTLREGLPFGLCDQNTASYLCITNNTLPALAGCGFMQRYIILPYSPGGVSGIATRERKNGVTTTSYFPRSHSGFSALAAADVSRHHVDDGSYPFSCFAALSLWLGPCNSRSRSFFASSSSGGGIRGLPRWPCLGIATGVPGRTYGSSIFEENFHVQGTCVLGLSLSES